MRDHILSTIAASQDGLVTRRQALDAGFTYEEIRHRVRRGAWQRVGRGSYAISPLFEGADAIEQYAVHVRARLMRQRRFAVASHGSAAVLHRLETLACDQRHVGVTLTRPHPVSGSYRVGDLRIMSAPLTDDDICEIHGVPVTSPARTVIDLSRELPFRAGLVTADSALRVTSMTRDDLQAVLLRTQGWPGIHTAMRVTTFADGLAETPLESLQRANFILYGVPLPRLQVLIGDITLIGRVDFLWEEEGVVGEADGLLKYTSPAVLRAEKIRQEGIEEGGFIVIRYDWDRSLRYGRASAERTLRALERGRRNRAA